MNKTKIEIKQGGFEINGAPTYAGRSHRGRKVEGLLLNSRMVQGTFDDLNPETVARWRFPDGEAWNPDRNTDEFIAAMPLWRAHGLLAITLNLQGGSPEGYSETQPWHNNAFTPSGGLRPEFMHRCRRIIEAADDLGMVVILGLFYFGQDWRLQDDDAVRAAVDNATTWVCVHGYNNVMIEIGNEVDLWRFTRESIKAAQCHQLINRARAASNGRLLISTSMKGNSIPPDAIIAASDYILLHGNGVSEPDRIREMVRITRASPAYRGQPIVFNEDDHFDFDKPDNNFLAALDEYASWGYFDYRMLGEGFDEGYQSMPANWVISSQRKRSFFALCKAVTSGEKK